MPYLTFSSGGAELTRTAGSYVDKAGEYQTVLAQEIIIHPDFYYNTLENDIAVIKVKPRFRGFGKVSIASGRLGFLPGRCVRGAV